MIYPNCSEIVVYAGIKDIDKIRNLIKHIIEETDLILIIRTSYLTYSKIPLYVLRSITEIVAKVSPDDLVLFNDYGGKSIGVQLSKLPKKVRRIISSLSIHGNFIPVQFIDEISKGSILISLDSNECLKFWIHDGDVASYRSFAKICRICSSSPLSSGGSIDMFEEWCRNNGYKSLVEIGWDDDD